MLKNKTEEDPSRSRDSLMSNAKGIIQNGNLVLIDKMIRKVIGHLGRSMAKEWMVSKREAALQSAETCTTLSHSLTG